MVEQRHLKISQDELKKIRDLYETVMSHACHGLFFREGNIFGVEIMDAAVKTPYKFFETATEMLKARGWVEDIKFTDDSVTVKGSIEVHEGLEGRMPQAAGHTQPAVCDIQELEGLLLRGRVRERGQPELRFQNRDIEMMPVDILLRAWRL